MRIAKHPIQVLQNRINVPQFTLNRLRIVHDQHERCHRNPQPFTSREQKRQDHRRNPNLYTVKHNIALNRRRFQFITHVQHLARKIRITMSLMRLLRIRLYRYNIRNRIRQLSSLFRLCLRFGLIQLCNFLHRPRRN